jgi:hypothetical protein
MQVLQQAFSYSEGLLDQLSRWRIAHCRLSAVAYAVYSKLPSTATGRLLHPQPQDAQDPQDAP